MVEALHDPAVGFGAGGAPQNIFTVGEVLFCKMLPGHGEIIEHQTQGAGDLLHCQVGVLHDYVHLKAAFAIVHGQGLEVPDGVIAALVIAVEANGHGPAGKTARPF